jgi:hypothetical protein
MSSDVIFFQNQMGTGKRKEKKKKKKKKERKKERKKKERKKERRFGEHCSRALNS